MHSSIMRTGRSLTVCWSLLRGGGDAKKKSPKILKKYPRKFLGGGGAVPGPRGMCLVWGAYLVPGGHTWSQGGHTWSQGGIPGRGLSGLGVSGLRGGGVSVSGMGGVWSQGVSVPCGGGGAGIPACTEADTSPSNRMTNRCKNITLATTSLRPLKIRLFTTVQLNVMSYTIGRKGLLCALPIHNFITDYL